LKTVKRRYLEKSHIFKKLLNYCASSVSATWKIF